MAPRYRPVRSRTGRGRVRTVRKLFGAREQVEQARQRGKIHIGNDRRADAHDQRPMGTTRGHSMW